MGAFDNVNDRDLMAQISNVQSSQGNSSTPMSDKDLMSNIAKLQSSRAGMFAVTDIDSFDTQEEKSEVSQSLFEKIISSPFATGIGFIGEAARREEGVFANALDQATKEEPSLKALLKGGAEAITGKKVMEFGDVLRSNGVDDMTASVTGLIMSAFLPSTFLLAGAGKTAKAGRLTAKQAQKLANVYTRSPNAAKDPLVHAYANFLSKDPRRVQQLMDNVDAVFPSAGVNKVQKGLRPAGGISPANPKQAKIISSFIQKGLKALKEQAPDVLGPSPETPLRIAREAMGDFDQIFKAERIRHNQLVKQLQAENPEFGIKAKTLLNDMFETVKKLEKNPVRRTNVPGSEVEASRKFFARLSSKIRSKKDGKFGLQELVDFRSDLGNLAEGSFQVKGGAPVVNSTINSLTKNLRTRISNIIKENFKSIEESDRIFVALGEVQDGLKLRGFKKPNQLGSFLKSKTRDPFKEEAVGLLDSILPEQSSIGSKLALFDNARANSLETQLSKIGVKAGDKISTERVANNFNQLTNPETEIQLLRKLNSAVTKISPKLDFMDRLTLFDLARDFTKPGSIFKAGAASGLAQGAVPQAGPVSMIAGVGATIPPIFARAVQGASKVGKIGSKIGNSGVVTQAEAEILKKIAELTSGFVSGQRKG